MGNGDAITANVSVTAPAKLTLRDVSIGALANSLGGMSAPQLTAGTWRCTADTLVSVAPAGSAGHGTWTLTRDH